MCIHTKIIEKIKRYSFKSNWKSFRAYSIKNENGEWVRYNDVLEILLLDKKKEVKND